MNKAKKSISFPLIFLISLILIGTIGYKILLHINFIDALYMTVITISTVGYGEISVMNVEAKIFSIILIFTSLGTVGYLFSTIVSYLLEGDVKKVLRRKKMESIISKMNGHYIICGAGETGYNAIKKFVSRNVDFVVIDKSEEKIDKLLSENIASIHGDASNEDILNQANISKAKGLISCLSKDSENVFTVLTARQMNENLYIVSRSVNKGSDEKLKRAGANNTISPNEIGGTRMASLMLRPNVMAFLDTITHAGDVILDLEEVEIKKGASILNQSLKSAAIPQKTGLIVLAIKKKNNKLIEFNPSSDVILEESDVMIVLGKEEQVENLKNIAS
ncbi:MAG: potassium channel family protein [Peptoniphilaceae bacterium]